MAKKGNKRVYHLEISYDTKEDLVDYINQFIDEEVKTFYYGDINIGSYFDDEGLMLVEDSYELGES